MAGNHSKNVLAAFKSAAPPLGTSAGLSEMLSVFSDADFRKRAGYIWDALIGEHAADI